MSVLFVQFKDAAESEVIGIFGCRQPEKYCAFQGEVSEDDPRYQAYLAFAAPVVEPLPDAPEAAGRAWRDAEILRVTWLRDRHRDEVEIGGETTISAEQYAELLVYIKALRDWPASADFPAEHSRPVVPEWVASQTP